jgi:hypothetical protein
MDRIEYFINKFWNVATGMSPIVYILILISMAIFFFITKYLILKFKPNTKGLNYKAGLIALIIGPIAFFGVLYVVVLILLRNQPF